MRFHSRHNKLHADRGACGCAACMSQTDNVQRQQLAVGSKQSIQDISGRASAVYYSTFMKIDPWFRFITEEKNLIHYKNYFKRYMIDGKIRPGSVYPEMYRRIDCIPLGIDIRTQVEQI